MGEVVAAGSNGRAMLRIARKRRRFRGGTVIDSGRACYDKTVEDWGWGRHWENKGKNREFSNAIKGIQGHGRKCLQHPGNSSARELGNALYGLADSLRARQNIFVQAVTDSAALFNKELNEDEATCIVGAPSEVLGCILTIILGDMIDKILKDPSVIMIWIRALGGGRGAVCPDERDCVLRKLDLSYLAGESIKECQLSLVADLADSVFRSGDGNVIIEVLLKLDGALPECNCLSKPKGIWDVQAWVDLAFLRLAGHALQFERSGDNTALPKRFWSDCAALVANHKLLSARMRTHFKALPGASLNMGKAAWECIKSNGKSQSDAGQYSSPEKLTKLRLVLKKLREASKSDDTSFAYDIVVEIYEKLNDDFVNFGELFGDYTPGVADVGKDEGLDSALELKQLAYEIFEALMDCCKVVLEEHQPSITTALMIRLKNCVAANPTPEWESARARMIGLPCMMS